MKMVTLFLIVPALAGCLRQDHCHMEKGYGSLFGAMAAFGRTWCAEQVFDQIPEGGDLLCFNFWIDPADGGRVEERVYFDMHEPANTTKVPPEDGELQCKASGRVTWGEEAGKDPESVIRLFFEMDPDSQSGCAGYPEAYQALLLATHDHDRFALVLDPPTPGSDPLDDKDFSIYYGQGSVLSLRRCQESERKVQNGTALEYCPPRCEVDFSWEDDGDALPMCFHYTFSSQGGGYFIGGQVCDL